MSGWDFTPEEETQLFDELNQIDQRAQQYRATSSPQIAETAGSIFRTHPYAAPGTVLSTAKAVVSGALTREAADRIISIASANAAKWAAMEKPKQKKKSWWERNVFDKAKTASRWTMAGLNFVPQAAVGLVAQPFTENEKGQKGWFISTDLGTLIENDEVAGEGWFMGGRAAELQAQRAREYRGEIDGHAFTIGRGLATTIFQPGSREYNILSGLTDAAVALAVPSVPGIGAVKGAVKGASAVTGLRTLAGLTEAESAVIDVKKVSGWLRTNSGMSVVKRVAKIANIDEAMRIFPNVDDPNFWVGVVDAKTDRDALKFLESSLGLSGPRAIDDINISRLDDVTAYMKGSWLARKSGIAKMMDTVPGQHLVLQGGNPRDSARSVRNMNNYLKLLKVDPKDRKKLVEEFTRALNDANGDVFAVMDKFQNVMNKSFDAMGVPEAARSDLMAGVRQFTENKAVYGAGDNLGDPTNYGAKIILQDGTVVDAPLATAGLQSEMLRQLSMILPDPRRVRRMMSNVGWLYGKGQVLANPENYRKLRMPFSALEAFQQEIWRPITLMTGGYALRNMTDSALRLSLKSGMKGGALHPVQWIQIAAYKRFRGDLLGQAFDPTLAKTTLERSADEFADAVGQGLREGIDPISRTRREIATKNWEFVRRSAGSKYRKGIQDEISLLHNDLVTKMLAQGSSSDEIIDVLKSTTEGKRYLRDLQGRWSNRTFTDANGQKVVGSAEIIKADGTFNDFNIKSFVEDYAAKRLQDTTRDNPLLVRAVADGKFTAVDGTELSMFVERGGIPVGYNKEWDEAVQRLVDSGADLKQAYKYRIESDEFMQLASKDPNVRRVLDSWNKTTDYFFSSLYPKRSKYLMQSPAFRQFYYKQVDNLFDELDQAGFNNVLSNLQKAAKADGKTLNVDWLARYVGNTDLAESMMKRINGAVPAGKGRLSLDQLDSYAKGFALDETKKLFYNASEKSNFADILRIVAPFGSAWAEVMNSWGKIAMTNPEAIRKVGVSVQGLRDADPDADGRGFFWKDPTTGEYVFNYPFSDKLGPLVSGLGGIGALGGLALGGLPGLAGGAVGGAAVGAGLQAAGMATPGTSLIAPAKTLTMGFNFIPGVGPFVQWSASKLLGNKPDADWIMKFVAPYGEPQLTVAPAWAQKLKSALADPENDRLLGDMVVDVMVVLKQTGDYNLADANERERLEKDAISRARTLLVMRSLGQFVGPTRPDVDFKVETYNGDMFTREISKAFRVMQDEDYDTAVERFLNTFGDDAFLYIAGKSKSEVGGLDASTKFGKFERENSSLFSTYKDVAGFFAPVGENFDYQVYLRQIRSGERRKLKPSELIEEAQAQVGRAIYRSLTREMGSNPNADQREVLSFARKKLIELFPGFGTSPIDINKLSGQIQQVYEAAFDSMLDGNPVAEGARAYLQIRDMAMNQALARGVNSLGGKKVADLRGLLRSAADEIIRRYPEFERLYDRILFNEIDVDAGE
jgi:hypothetical protein